MTRKVTVLFSVLVLAFLLALPQSALAAQAPVTGRCEGYRSDTPLSWTLDENGILTVSGTGEMTSFSGCPWYTADGYLHNRIREVVLEEGVPSIGAFAFSDCPALERVTIPASVEMIGLGAFAHCPSLREITVDDGNSRYYDEDGVLFDNKYSYYYGDGFRTDRALIAWPGGRSGTYSVPDGVVIIEERAFAGACGLTAVTLPASVKQIYGNVFEYCSTLTSIAVDDDNSRYYDRDGVLFDHEYGVSTDVLGNAEVNALVSYPCAREGAYEVPNGTQSLADRSFCGSERLTRLGIPSGCVICGGEALEGCDALTAVEVAAGNVNLYAVDGALCSREAGTIWGDRGPALVFCPRTRMGAYTVPDGIRTVGVTAFAGCSLSEITLPECVEYVSDGAFSDCASLTAIHKEGDTGNLYAVDGVLFQLGYEDATVGRCGTALRAYPGGRTGDYTVPAGVTTIGTEAFCGAKQLGTLTLPESVEILDYDAMRGAAIHTLIASSRLSAIGSCALSRAVGLRDIYYGGTEAAWTAALVSYASYNPAFGALHPESDGPDAVFGAPERLSDGAWEVTLTLRVPARVYTVRYDADGRLLLAEPDDRRAGSATFRVSPGTAETVKWIVAGEGGVPLCPAVLVPSNGSTSIKGESEP